MNNFFEQLSKIIQSAGNLYGLLALIVVATAFLAFWFFKTDPPGRRERILIYMILFFGAIVLALAAGFSSGQEIAAPSSDGADPVLPPTEAPESDPNTVRLSPDTLRKLEGYLASKNIEASEENKSAALNEAIDNLSADSGSPLDNENPIEAQSGSTNKTAYSFTFNLQGCTRVNEKNLDCLFLITNQKQEDRILRIDGRRSRIVDQNGGQYFGNKIEFGNVESSYVDQTLVYQVDIQARLSFAEVETSQTQLRLLEVSFWDAESREASSEKFFDVSIAN